LPCPDCANEAVNSGKCLDSRRIDDAWAFWRSRYHLTTPGVAALARKEHIHLDRRFNDHAPLTIDDDFTL
jgi:exonuclease III